MARGWIQGWPKKFGEIHTTRAFPLAAKAAPRVEPGGRFGGTLSANGRRLAEAVVELEKVSDDPVYFGKRPGVNMRYFPQLAGGGKAKPAVCELVRSILSERAADGSVGGAGRSQVLSRSRQRTRRLPASPGAAWLPIQHGHDY